VIAETPPGSIPEGQGQSLIAECPNGTRLIGLGGRYLGGGVGSDTIFNALNPIDGPDQNIRPDDAVRTRGFTVSGSGGIGSQAVCAAGTRVLNTVKAVAEPDKGATAMAPCPSGTHVTSGGGQVTGDTEVTRLHSSSPFDGGDRDKRPDDGWRVRAYNPSNSAVQVVANVFCADEQPRYQEQEYEIQGGIGLGTSECETGRPLSVGARTSSPAAKHGLKELEVADSLEVNGGDADSAPDDFGSVFISGDEEDPSYALNVTLICGP